MDHASPLASGSSGSSQLKFDEVEIEDISSYVLAPDILSIRIDWEGKFPDAVVTRRQYLVIGRQT